MPSGTTVNRKKNRTAPVEAHNESNSHDNRDLAIGERQRQVASLLAQSRTEAEIANQLKVSQSTISRDIQALREASGRFLHDLAKSDLVFWYQQSIRGIDEIKRNLWDKVNSDDGSFTPRDKLMGYRLIMIAEETRFRLLEKGPLLLSYESLAEKLKKFEMEAIAVGSQER